MSKSSLSQGSEKTGRAQQHCLKMAMTTTPIHANYLFMLECNVGGMCVMFREKFLSSNSHTPKLCRYSLMGGLIHVNTLCSIEMLSMSQREPFLA